MHEDRPSSALLHAVTISREYGSGGGEIAARLARRLGWQLIDHEVVVGVAKELGVSEAEAEAHDEHVEGLIAHLLYSLRAADPATLAAAPAGTLYYPVNTQDYQHALQRVVEAAVETGRTVIVGRGSQVLLAGRRDVLHVRVIAPLDRRIAYVMRREGLGQAAAHARIQLKERDRVRYLQTVHHQYPENPHLYDLVVNTGVIDLESVIDLICLAMTQKAKQMVFPVEELGPGAGLARYPTRPGDFRPPERLNGFV
jgi:CMP/dCMP kinase